MNLRSEHPPTALQEAPPPSLHAPHRTPPSRWLRRISFFHRHRSHQPALPQRRADRHHSHFNRTSWVHTMTFVYIGGKKPFMHMAACMHARSTHAPT